MKKWLPLLVTLLVSMLFVGAISWAVDPVKPSPGTTPTTPKPVLRNPAGTTRPAATSADAQQEPRLLRGSPQPPKEIQELETEAKKQTQKPLERQLTKEELEQKLQMIPNEREKLNAAKANRKGDLRTASPQPPKEIQELETEAKKQTQKPLERQLTKEELEQKLQMIPNERMKLQKIKQGYKPTSQTGKTGFSLSWLNPFRIQEAFAQTIYSFVPTKFNLVLNSSNRFYSASPYGYGWANFFGLIKGLNFWDYPCLYNFGTMKGYVSLQIKIPANGWYIINVYASGKDRASLYTGEALKLTTWDFASSTNSYNDYATLQYLAQGYHSFVFKPDYYTSVIFPVVSISITSYP
jgi:hypothetical protein